VVLILVLAVACAVFSVTLAATRVFGPRRQVHAALAQAAAYGASAPTPQAERAARVSVLEPLARAGVKLLPAGRLDDIARKLAAAGLVRKVSPASFVAAKILAAGVGAFAGLTAGAAGGAARAAVGAVVLAATGFLTPDVLLNARVRRRREQILEELPNALDLLAVSVEAGLGLDAACGHLVESTEGPLGEELGLVLAELRVGVGRHDALRRLAERVPAPETAAFTRAVIHADQLGTSLSQTLRVQAHDARLRRQAVAEEKAGKAPVRMLFPTVFFVFPAMFVVVLGPAVLALLREF
jgi:tight adherence protein C